jgi:hypothetical protein
MLENLLKIHAALGSNNQHTVGNIVRELATANPEVLKARLDDLPAGLRETARAGLAKVALNENFSAGVTELSQMKGGMNLFLDALMGDPKLMEQAAGDPSVLPPGWFASMATRNSSALVREDPAKWLEADLESMGLSAPQAGQVRQSAMSQLALKDPDRVAAMIASGECDESQRQNAIQAVAARYSTDKEKLDAWLATLTGAGDLDAAKRAIEPQGGTTQSELANPGSLLASLAGGGTELTYQSSKAMATWGPDKRAEFIDAFDELDKGQKPVVAAKFFDNPFNIIPAEMSGHLIGYLLANPPEPSSDATTRRRGQPVGQVASKLAAEWADEDPSAASRWVGSLPAGEGRLWAAKNLAARWAEYEPAAARRWISTLPGDEGKAVREHLDSGTGTSR